MKSVGSCLLVAKENRSCDTRFQIQELCRIPFKFAWQCVYTLKCLQQWAMEIFVEMILKMTPKVLMLTRWGGGVIGGIGVAPGPPWLPIGNLSIPPSGHPRNRSTYWTSVSPYCNHHHQGRSDKAPTLLLCAQLRVEATSPSKTNHPAIEGIF